MRKAVAVVVLVMLVASMVSVGGVKQAEATVDVEPDEEGIIYEWYNTSSYGAPFGGAFWQRFDPDGDPSPYNQDPDNWWIPDAYRNDPYPYGATTQTRNTERVWYWFNSSDSTDDNTGTWTEYDPEGGPHDSNQALPDGDARKVWAHPYWARTTSTEQGAPKPVGYWPVIERGAEEPAPEREVEPTEDVGEDPFGEWGPYIDAMDDWFQSLFDGIGIPNPLGGGIRDYFTDPV